jgi:phosphopantetheine--protein transferase-like protein
MIGNDIVDLSAATFSCSERRDRYALKILSPKEFVEYTNAPNKSSLLWRYWSIKEAVFKAYLQQFLNASFSPSKIQVQLIDTKLSVARIDETIFNCSTHCDSDAIYSTAVQNVNQKTVSQFVVNDCKSNASKHVRSLLKNEVSRLNNISTEALFIRKSDGKIPRLYNKKTKESWQISLTHHGKFLGYAIAL